MNALAFETMPQEVADVIDKIIWRDNLGREVKRTHKDGTVEYMDGTLLPPEEAWKMPVHGKEGNS